MLGRERLDEVVDEAAMLADVEIVDADVSQPIKLRTDSGPTRNDIVVVSGLCWTNG